MIHKILYYNYDDTYYAVIDGDDSYIAFYDMGKWLLGDKIITIPESSKKVDEEDVLYHTLGNLPYSLFDDLGFVFDNHYNDEKIDSFKRFFDDFIEFARDDYTRLFHNKDKSLKYLATELDTHYGTDYYETINSYYNEFIERKNEYKNICITPLDNDFLIQFNKNIIDIDDRKMKLLTITNDKINSIKTDSGNYYITLKEYTDDEAYTILFEAAKYCILEDYKSWYTDFNDRDNTREMNMIAINRMNVVVKDGKFYGAIIKERGFLKKRQHLICLDNLACCVKDGGPYSGSTCEWKLEKPNKVCCYKITEAEADADFTIPDYGDFSLQLCEENEKVIIFDALTKWRINYTYISHTVDKDDYYYNGNAIGLLPVNCIIQNNMVIGFRYNEHSFIIDECMTHKISTNEQTGDTIETRAYELLFSNDDNINYALGYSDKIIHSYLNSYRHLLEIKTPKHIKAIDKDAFLGFESLRRVIFNDGLVTISQNVFKWCILLNQVIIPESVTHIDPNAFYSCENLDIYYCGTKEKFEKNNFNIVKTNLYYYSEDKPTKKGMYWHYVNDEPVKW